MFKTTLIKMCGTQTWPLLRHKIFPMNTDKSCPLLAQTFVFRKVMHSNARCASFVGTVRFIGATGHAIIHSSLLRSLLRHDTRVFRTTNYVTSCVLTARKSDPAL